MTPPRNPAGDSWHSSKIIRPRYRGRSDSNSCCLKHVKGSRGHQRWLEGPVNTLTKVDRADYVALIIQRILKFLQLECNSSWDSL